MTIVVLAKCATHRPAFLPLSLTHKPFPAAVISDLMQEPVAFDDDDIFYTEPAAKRARTDQHWDNQILDYDCPNVEAPMLDYSRAVSAG